MLLSLASEGEADVACRHAAALAQGLESLGGGLLEEDAILKTAVDRNAASLEAELDAASQVLLNDLSQLATTLSNKVATNDDVTSLEAVLESTGLEADLNQALGRLPTKRDADPGITRTAIDDLIEPVNLERDAVSREAFANVADVVALRSDANDKIDANLVYSKDEVDAQVTVLNDTLNAKAVAGTIAEQEAVEVVYTKADPVMIPRGDRACASANLNKVKYNPSSRKFEVCSQGTLRHHWRPVGSSKDCVTVDAGRCTRCDGGLAVSRSGGCVPAAEMVHLDLNNNKVNQAPHASAEPPTLTNLAVRSLVDCSL